MDKNVIVKRLEQLRNLMRQERLGAFIFPSTDPHNGEYTPDYWKGREFISGFNGSAGTAVVTLKDAALWTDSRYFIAAEEQLRGTGFQLMREKIEGTPTIAEWIGRKLSESRDTEVGIDGMVNSEDTVEALKDELRRQGGITLRTNFDPLETLWEERPELPLSVITIQPIAYAGEECSSKIDRIRQSLIARKASGILVSALDDIAWTLNLRGKDVHCTPLFVSYLLITKSRTRLYIDKRKLTKEVSDYLAKNKVLVSDYNDIANDLRDYIGYNLLMDGSETSYTLFNKPDCVKLNQRSPIPAMKAVKNETEIGGYRKAMLRDGIAMVKFLRWLKSAIETGTQTEISIDRKLTSFRQSQENYRDLSFDTIAGYEEHGAIVHYEATKETDKRLMPQGLLLLDSGAQYADGTTDITRTIALGPVTEEQKHIYTLVLKGHIQLSMLKFPKGASGTQLDALARKDMWKEGLNYMHGTGHGVGSYLSVHEGPHQIRMEWKPTPLVAGMTVTNEPGLYLPGRFGVRIENTMLITPYRESEFGEFLQLEPLTLCPIDTTPIDLKMLTAEEVEWLDNYHRHVFDTLSPHLNYLDRDWLAEATKPLACH